MYLYQQKSAYTDLCAFAYKCFFTLIRTFIKYLLVCKTVRLMYKKHLYGLEDIILKLFMYKDFCTYMYFIKVLISVFKTLICGFSPYTVFKHQYPRSPQHHHPWTLRQPCNVFSWGSRWRMMRTTELDIFVLVDEGRSVLISH